MADGLLRKKVYDQGLNIIVDSAGTSSYHIGEAPDARMRETARNHGVPIDELRARQFSVSDFDEFDLIYAMDQSNYNNMASLSRSEEDLAKLHLILNEIFPGQNMEVPDPYFGGDQGFKDVFNMLDEATDKIIEKIQHGS